MTRAQDSVARKIPMILAVGGGKGGVGKSFFSSNLAVQYAQAGFKVVLLDLDFGAANLHTIFGMRQPSKGLGEYFLQGTKPVAEYLIETNISNLQLLPSSGFIPELANIKYGQKARLVEHIKELQADLVILDLAAGTASNVIDFFTMTNAGIIVSTPEPTAIVNAYEFLKNAIYRMLFRMFRDKPKVYALLQLSFAPQNALKIATVSDLVTAVKKVDSWAAENILDICQDMDIHLILNQARTFSEVNLGARLHDIAQKHLCLQINYGGILFYNEEVSASVFKMSPLSICNPNSVTIEGIKRIATQVLHSLHQRQNQDSERIDFQTQMLRTTKYAQKDFEKNLLLQRYFQRQHLKNNSVKDAFV